MIQRIETGFDPKTEGRDIIVTRADAAIDWVRKNSCWPMPMGLACCAIELMAVGASRFDIAPVGAGVMRVSPRQTDFVVVSGTRVDQTGGGCQRVLGQLANT